MQLSDILRGVGIIVFITAVAGTIAYVGDRVGHQVGRKRLTMFGIRPRYTSTIIAVGTGMMIALVVTLGAILLSKQVSTALFRLNALNAQITDLQTRYDQLRTQTKTSRLIVSYGQLMSSKTGFIPPNTPAKDRVRIVNDYLHSVVADINQTLTPFGLKPFVARPDAVKHLDDIASDFRLEAVNQLGIYIVTTADENLFENDTIHFRVDFAPDARFFPSGTALSQVRIPAGKGVNILLALNELSDHVTSAAVDQHMLRVFASAVRIVQTYPSVDRMQQMVTGNGTYLLTAYAATDIYTHTGIPIVVTLAAAP